MEQSVRGQRAARVDSLRLEALDRRPDDSGVFLTERAILTGMRIETRDCEAWSHKAKALCQITGDDPTCFDDEIAGQAGDHLLKRQVDGHWNDREFGRPKQHY